MTYKLELIVEGDLQGIAKVDLALAELQKMPGVKVERWGPYTPRKQAQERK